MITTDRLLLRGWLPRDRAPFAAMNADPQVMDFPRPLSRAESDAEIDDFAARWRADGFCFAAIERRHDGALIGMAGLARCDLGGRPAPRVEIGWRLARAHWGQGYATEAGRAWLDHGFTVLGLEEIVAFTDTGHHRSRAVMDRLGMTRDPARDFAHPDVPPDHPLSAHVLYAARAPAGGNRPSANPAFPP